MLLGSLQCCELDIAQYDKSEGMKSSDKWCVCSVSGQATLGLRKPLTLLNL